MPWSAQLKSIAMSNGIARITLAYTNGSDIIERLYDLASPGTDFVRSRAAQDVRNLEELEVYVAAQVIGPIDLTPVVPSKDDTDRTTFFEQYAKLNALKISVEKGLTKPDDADLVALDAEVKATFKPEYTTDFRWR